MKFGAGEVAGETLHDRVSTAMKFNARIRREMREGYQNKVIPKHLPLAGEADDCDMGKWLLWEIAQGEKSDHLKQIDLNHREFHRLGHLILDAMNRSDAVAGAAAWREYLRVSMELGSQLADWLREL